MPTSDTKSRERYRPSGNVAWGRFAVGALLTLLVSGGLAVLLYLALLEGFYSVLIAPLFASLPVAGMVLLAVSKGHCRSRLAAALLGCTAGMVLYLGYYYVGLVHTVGWGAAARLDLLPRYIAFRMETDVHQDPSVSNTEEETQENGPGDVSLSWIAFGLELALVSAIIILAGVIRASRAYCESCSRWKRQELLILPPGRGRAVLEALTAGSLKGLAAPGAPASKSEGATTSLQVEYCEKQGQRRGECPVFFSVREIKSRGAGFSKLQQFDAAMGKTFARRWKLTAEEIETLLPKFPVLREQTPAAELLAAEPEPSGTAWEAAFFEAASFPFAEPVPDRFAGKILTKANIALCNLLAVTPVVLLLVGIGVALGGLYLLLPDEGSSDFHSLPRLIAGAFAALVGVLLTAVFGVMCLRDVGFFGAYWLYRRTCGDVLIRPDALVRPEQRDVVFVEVIPRENWYRTMLETATDVGLLRVDAEQGEILFEGDKERYRIPLGAVSSCDVETASVTLGQTTVTHHFIVLQGETRDGSWELSLSPRWGKGLRTEKRRERQTGELCRRIQFFAS